VIGNLDPVTRAHLERGVEGLVDEFRGIFSRETIDRYVQESLEELPAARFSDFVPVLVHRFARERLRALGQSQGTIAKDVPEVLFVCVQNSGRSQMAAGLLYQRSAGLVHVRSAGSDPAESIHQNVVQAMEEIGVDLSQEFPKPLTDEVVRAADVVITMGCGDACPIYRGKKYEDWTVEDPAHKSLDEVREIRDSIDERVRRLIAELTAEPVGSSASE
jgi:arsenate reductase (thioredoxin)